ncbi:hypothetical protein TESG_00629 [Trichophyton tonsurans CBS 112818]|uniref:Uncharacterized protein n=2 Tax=Trichophyton TaxID=5550 RepID=F2PRV0_TRIEC|nr:hypothetical protein TESG_00629 [Trichophyton tonsurans CBS 112818]EGE04618.1 hypothetical protein TEQG_03486 [Trichophyton equinum CBS 127.97]
MASRSPSQLSSNLKSSDIHLRRPLDVPPAAIVRRPPAAAAPTASAASIAAAVAVAVAAARTVMIRRRRGHRRLSGGHSCRRHGAAQQPEQEYHARDAAEHDACDGAVAETVALRARGGAGDVFSGLQLLFGVPLRWMVNVTCVSVFVSLFIYSLQSTVYV